LKAFVAQLVFFYGSVEKFFCRVAQDNGDFVNPQEIREAITRIKPGYYLLIAQKAGT
jgi:hypothetical protein